MMPSENQTLGLASKIAWALACLVVVLGLAAGYFLSPALAKQKGYAGLRVRTHSGKNIHLYRDYQALVIGAGDYKYWPSLQGPVNDAREVGMALGELGFNVKLVLNPDSQQLRTVLEKLPYGLGTREARGILVYFSGHGETLTQVDGGKSGYLVPVDCPLPEDDPVGFRRSAVSMADILEISLLIKSRHVLWMFDSCFSGSVFNVFKAKPSAYIEEKIAEPVRLYITAGNENEQVPDHSVFKSVFIQAIQKGFADRNHDGYVTGEELGNYLQEKVTIYSRKRQHPQYGKINNPKLDKGDFVFHLPSGMQKRAEKQKKQIMLKKADKLFAENALTTPVGSSAFDYYKKVLELDPVNPRARKGLKNIVAKYVGRAEALIKTGDFAQAQECLSQAEKVLEDDSRVLALRGELRKQKENLGMPQAVSIRPQEGLDRAREKLMRTIKVSSQKPWTDTGLIVNTGDRISIIASGKIKFGDPARDNTTDPNGTKGHSACHHLCDNATPHALVGNIARDDPNDNLDGAGFTVGTVFKGAVPFPFTSATSGRLYLGFNDGGVICKNGRRVKLNSWAWQGDNAGSFEAKVFVERKLEGVGTKKWDAKNYSICVGSYRRMSDAKKHADKIKKYEPFIIRADLRGKGRWHRVCLGNYATPTEALVNAKMYEHKGFGPCFIVSIK